MLQVYQACPCGGTIVVTPTRPGTEAKREHLNSDGQAAPCPNAK
jgi:diaminopimelate epimerase